VCDVAAVRRFAADSAWRALVSITEAKVLGDLQLSIQPKYIPAYTKVKRVRTLARRSSA
jgi:hypothetical protein